MWNDTTLPQRNNKLNIAWNTELLWFPRQIQTYNRQVDAGVELELMVMLGNALMRQCGDHTADLSKVRGMAAAVLAP